MGATQRRPDPARCPAADGAFPSVTSNSGGPKRARTPAILRALVPRPLVACALSFGVASATELVVASPGTPVGAEETICNQGSDRPDSLLASPLLRPGSSELSRSLRAAWVCGWGGPAPTAALSLDHPTPHAGGISGAGIRYYPSRGVQTVDGLRLTPQQAFLYGVRRRALNRGQTALKGADLGGSVGLFAGAMASSLGWLSESQALWLAGGAAALGALYGASAGYESTAWREEWRWPKTLPEEPAVEIRVP